MEISKRDERVKVGFGPYTITQHIRIINGKQFFFTCSRGESSTYVFVSKVDGGSIQGIVKEISFTKGVKNG